MLEKAAGLLMFNPPDRAGKANKRLSRSLGASLPNSLGSRVVLITSSTGCKKLSIPGVVLDR